MAPRASARLAALAALALVALALATLAAPAAAQPAPALVWNVSCCRAFEALAAMTVERSGSSLPADACRAGGRRCMDLKLIREFVEQSRALLGRDRVQAEDAALRITLPADAEPALELLAWAFLGRVVALPSPGAAGQQKVLLEYDIHRNSMHVKRDSCEFDKALHSAMVLASVALLVFFISMTVVERASARAQHAPPALPPALVQASAPGLKASAPGLPAPGVSVEGKTTLQVNSLGPIFGPIPTKARPRLPWSIDGHC
jgi:hypothetical protein